MTNVLVTGGSGFVGRHLVSELAARGRRVRVLDVRPPTHRAPAVEYVEGSVLEELVITDSIGNHDTIAAANKVRHLTIAPLLAEAIRRIADESSVSSLFD